jgi:hypothetical protein
MKALLERILLSAGAEMWSREPTLSKYTSETAEHELNLAFHYATELRHWFPWLDCDFDVTKVNFGRDRPDIILHRRNSNAANFLVVEIKRARYRSAVAEDLKQIRQRWFAENLLYRFGASVVLDEDNKLDAVQVLERTSPAIGTQKTLTDFNGRLRRPDLCTVVPQSLDGATIDLGGAPTPDGQALEGVLDQHVFALYGLTLDRNSRGRQLSR